MQALFKKTCLLFFGGVTIYSAVIEISAYICYNIAGDIMKLDYIDKGSEFDFGRTSADYARYRDIYPRSMYDKLIEFGIGREGQSILDLGSGTAILPVNMSGIGARFTATDISENQIALGKKLAAERGIDCIDFCVCPAEDTGLDSNSFDAVTAVQCFPYFDSERAADEILRVLKPGGLLCIIMMDWKPLEDDVIAEMEAIVKKYNPTWSGCGFDKYRYAYPEWAEGRFDIQTIHSYDAVLSFSREDWLGRVKSCRGVGASLPQDRIEAFENEYRELLSKHSEPLELKHQIHIEIYKSLK